MKKITLPNLPQSVLKSKFISTEEWSEIINKLQYISENFDIELSFTDTNIKFTSNHLNMFFFIQCEEIFEYEEHESFYLINRTLNRLIKALENPEENFGFSHIDESEIYPMTTDPSEEDWIFWDLIEKNPNKVNRQNIVQNEFDFKNIILDLRTSLSGLNDFDLKILKQRLDKISKDFNLSYKAVDNYVYFRDNGLKVTFYLQLDSICRVSTDLSQKCFPWVNKHLDKLENALLKNDFTTFISNCMYLEACGDTFEDEELLDDLNYLYWDAGELKERHP